MSWSGAAAAAGTGSPGSGGLSPHRHRLDHEGLAPMSSLSMYTELIEAALAEVYPQGEPISSAQALAEVVRRRPLLASSGWSGAGPPNVPATLAEEVAYDVALIRLARSVDVECDPRNFGWPRDERRKVERDLLSRGFRLQ